LIGPDFVISFHREQIPAIDKVADKWKDRYSERPLFWLTSRLIQIVLGTFTEEISHMHSLMDMLEVQMTKILSKYPLKIMLIIKTPYLWKDFMQLNEDVPLLNECSHSLENYTMSIIYSLIINEKNLGTHL
jgi:hypothetical protein